ncbi:Imm1 family immunity protein [Prauserella cavernicola]|uniref:Immunity protein Imm1 n=1 Tax=Prauserella cavernicola TaxID=2800127 RepID=A0A934V2L4_9PSEU|nr:Imm1 family immunity protein [Prauserella cavernicola]MBK1786041.1 hypothetical protein [Prauserella cavernicola]
MTSTLARHESYDIAAMTDADALIAMMTTVNGERRTPEAGVLWWLFNSADPTHELIVGVRGDRGCLLWGTAEASFRPADGLNTDHVPYFTWQGHDFEQDPGVETPVERVYQAVREYVTTGQRPTCVQWVPAPL